MITKSNIYGLVLCGGKSSRMGTDKGKLAYHGIPHREYLYNLLNTLCKKTYLSIRQSQQEEISGQYPIIVDADKYKGPFNGILSAHEYKPQATWLVIACDLPFLNHKTLKYLIDSRNNQKIATVFATHKTKLPEPLCAIWEPEGLHKAKKLLEAAQISGPRKFLIDADIQSVFPENDQVLFNANSVNDYKQARINL